AADGGTLFLDEIGNLPLSGQVKLLRVLQTGEFERLGSHQTRKVKVRVISATNADLAEDIASGRFREDLFYRLNVIELALPPLNQRQDDILPLVNHFIGQDFSLSKPTQQALVSYPWPGNVRELENACKRAVILAASPTLTMADFGLKPVSGEQPVSASSPVESQQAQEKRLGDALTQDSASSEADRVSTAETSRSEPTEADIEQALAEHNGVIARVAKSLGLSRQALYRRMEKFGIEK
uniref:sigma 54-interacting transcriptional regulator n=1 Tax=Shewanella sp. TaxID=50422 RepID=UPI003D11FB3A